MRRVAEEEDVCSGSVAGSQAEPGRRVTGNRMAPA